MNWLIIIPVGIVVIALLIFLIRRNQKDKRDFEKKINNDYDKPKEEEGDIDTEQILK
jgi:hypothetical protein